MLDLFTKQAEAVGAECLLVTDRRQAIDAVLSTLQTEGIEAAPGHWAVWAAETNWPGDDVRQEIIHSAPGLRFDVSREIAAESLIGISEMGWGVAQTGTLVSDASSVQCRLISTLPQIHIALLPVERIVSDMAAALAQIDVRKCAFVASITGPSRTADIERVLTIGVHGPRRLLILLIQNAQQGGAKQ